MNSSYMDQLWFEMPQYRKRSMDSAAWIPLYAIEAIERIGVYGHAGYRKDFFGCGTVAVPVAQRELAEKIGWSDLGIGRHYRGCIENGSYVPADVSFQSWPAEGLNALNLVMIQENRGELQGEWLIHPDLLLTLGLYPEGDSWVCPDEGYVEVIKIARNDDGRKAKLEIRTEFLKDYLCARHLGLWVTWYRMHDEIQEDVSYLTWPNLSLTDESPHNRWEGRVMEIHEGNGHSFGSQASIFHVTRTDVDFEEDVPQISLPTSDEGTASTTTISGFSGRKLYRVMGEIWREEWINPSTNSPRVRGDELPSKPAFIVDAAGNREDKTSLLRGGRWLWFKPEVVNALLSYRDGQLHWYTATTGGVGADAPGTVTFGVNELGLLNVYAKDIAYLPYWQQQLWAGFNISPDGKVSEELLKSQAVGNPCDTLAPEAFLESELNRLNKTIEEVFNIVAIKPHDDTPKILGKCHRFRATTFDGLLELAKDLARLSADSIDKAQLLTKLAPPKGEKWGSLKCLEKLVALKVGDEAARKLAAPLFGVYDLRLADAHLPSRELSTALANAGVNSNMPFVIQGHMMLHWFVSAVAGMTRAVGGVQASENRTHCTTSDTLM